MQNIFHNKILQSSGLILFFTAIGYILNYAYTLVAIHFLTPLQYSELAFLLAIYSLFGIFGATISNVSLPLLHEKENTKIKKQVIAVTKFVSIILFLLSVSIFPFLISKFFNIENYTNIILFSVGGILTISTALLTTHLQVVKNFLKVGLIQAFATFIKFFGSFVFLYFGFQIFGVAIALLLSSILALLFFFPYNKENNEIFENSISLPLLDKGGVRGGLVLQFWHEHKNLILKSFFGSLVLTLLITLDTILAKRLLHEDIVGYFVGISTLAKLFLFGIIAISSVVFPFYLSEKDVQKQKKILNYFLIFTFISSTLWLLFTYFFHDIIVPLILGVKYTEASIYLFPISLTIVSASFAYIFTQLSILKNVKNFLPTIFIYFAIFIISFLVYKKILSPNINAINITSLSNFLTLMFSVLSILFYKVSKN
jgi:O-antigen/teichoic acid export membrane protein